MSDHRDTLLFYWRLFGCQAFEPVTELKFAPGRRFRFDVAFPDQRVAVEAEGGVWTRGRHTRGKGYTRDCEKYNLASELGWTVLRYTSGMLEDDPQACIGQIVRVLESKKAG